MADQKITTLTNQRKFTMVYNDFLESKLVDYYEKLVFIALKRFADNETQVAFPSLNKISDITGISVPKVRRTLKSLESKHILKITHRQTEAAGNISNIYTLYDLPEIWKAGSEDEVKEEVQEAQEKRMIEYLKAKGYEITKKELADVPTKAHQQAAKHITTIDNKVKNEICQAGETYSMDQIRERYDYPILVSQDSPAVQDIDAVMDLLYDILNTSKKTIRIGGEDKPAEVVKSRLLKMTYEHILYAIEQYGSQTGRIKNQRSYMLTILYQAYDQMSLDYKNRVKSRDEA